SPEWSSALSEALRQSPRRFADVAPRDLEARFVAVVRVGYRLTFAPRYAVEQQADLRRGVGRCAFADVGEVGFIESEDVCKAAVVFGRDLPRLEVIDRGALGFGQRPRARVGRLAGVPVGSPGGVHLHIEPQPLRLGAERGFGEWRAADVAETHEED